MPTVSGVWKWNGYPLVGWTFGKEFNVNFTIPDTDFVGTKLFLSTGSDDNPAIYFDSDCIYGYGRFSNPKYQWIDFGTEEQTVSDDFYTYLTANATKQETSVETKLEGTWIINTNSSPSSTVVPYFNTSGAISSVDIKSGTNSAAAWGVKWNNGEFEFLSGDGSLEGRMAYYYNSQWYSTENNIVIFGSNVEQGLSYSDELLTFMNAYATKQEEPVVPTTSKPVSSENLARFKQKCDEYYATKTENNTKYTKPESGIPESDLAQAVKDNLNKDVGIQNYEVIVRQTLPTADANSPDFVQTTDGKIYRKKETGEAYTVNVGDTFVFKDDYELAEEFVSVECKFRNGSTNYIELVVSSDSGYPVVEYWTGSGRSTVYSADRWIADSYRTITFTEKFVFTVAQWTSLQVNGTFNLANPQAFVYEEIGDASSIAAKYTKPSSGIPKTDLASAVQTSLNKADTALQSVPLATSSVVGGVKPVAKTDDMTQSVGVDSNGALFTAPGGGSGGKLYLHSLVLDTSASSSLPYTSVKVDILSERSTAYTKQTMADDFAQNKFLSTVFHYTAPEQVGEGQVEGFLGFITSGMSGSYTISLYDMYLSMSGTQSSIPFEITSDTIGTINVGGGSGADVPVPTTSDNGKILAVSNGAYALLNERRLYRHRCRWVFSSGNMTATCYLILITNNESQYEWWTDVLNYYNCFVSGYITIDGTTDTNGVVVDISTSDSVSIDINYISSNSLSKVTGSSQTSFTDTVTPL